MSIEYCESATSMEILAMDNRVRCTEAGCGNLARLGFRYAGTTGRPMKEECGVLLCAGPRETGGSVVSVARRALCF
jgi:hypothetical protein